MAKTVAKKAGAKSRAPLKKVADTKSAPGPSNQERKIATELKKLREVVARQDVQLRALADRQAIIDCTHRFSRGVNRLDKDILKSAFHPGAIDDHGFFVGDRDEILDWIDEVYTGLSTTQHFVTNHTIELDGDTAHGETYWFVANIGKDGYSVIIRGGRYIDRFERRGGVWAIMARVCLVEWNGALAEVRFPPDAIATLALSGISTKDRNDPSYQRPLKIKRKPTSVKYSPSFDQKK